MYKVDDKVKINPTSLFAFPHYFEGELTIDAITENNLFVKIKGHWIKSSYLKRCSTIVPSKQYRNKEEEDLFTMGYRYK